MASAVLHQGAAAMMALCLAGQALPAATPHAPAPPVAAHVAAPVPAVPVRDIRTRDLPTYELQVARKRMLAGRWISYPQMRALADFGDGLAAFRYAQRLVEMEDADLLDDAAHYFARAAHGGRDYAVGPLLRILERKDVTFSPQRLTDIETALRGLALSGNAKASKAMIDFYQEGHPFGKSPERAAELMGDLALAGNPDMALDLVLNLVAQGADKTDPARVGALLDVAMTSNNLGTRTTAANLRALLLAPQQTLKQDTQ